MTRILDFIAAWRYWLGYVVFSLFMDVVFAVVAHSTDTKFMIFGYNATGLFSGVMSAILYVGVMLVALRPLQHNGFMRFYPRHWIKLESNFDDSVIFRMWDTQHKYQEWADRKGYRMAVWNNGSTHWIGFHSEEILCLAKLSV